MKTVVKLPSPKTPPLLQMLNWVTNPISYMEEVAQNYGDIFVLKIGWNFSPLVFVSNPQVIQRIFTDSKKFKAPGSGERIFQPVLGEYSITRTLDSSRYMRKRKLLMPPLHGERVVIYSQLIRNVTEDVIGKYTLGEPFSLQIAMQEISLELMLGGVFGFLKGERRELLKKLMISWLEALSNPISSSLLYVPLLQRDLGSWSPWSRFRHLSQQINQLLEVEIQERRQNYDPSRKDILTLLMSAHDEAGQPMSNEELRDEMMTLLAAGHETTSMAMTMALYWIHNQPNIKNQLLGELKVLGDFPNPITISQLPYLTAVCKETLRIYPIAYMTFPRVVQSPVDLMGYELDPGTEVVASIYLTHHLTDLYPDPKQFKPERFLEKHFSPYEYLPFGGGSHLCIGESLAIFEMKMVLATILSRYQTNFVNTEPLRLKVRRFSLAPANDLKMLVSAKYDHQESPLSNSTNS